jgi:hypothetical protein
MIERIALVPIPKSVPTKSLGNLRAVISLEPKEAEAPKPVFPEDVVEFSPEAKALLAGQSSAAIAQTSKVARPGTPGGEKTEAFKSGGADPASKSDSKAEASNSTETDPSGEPLSSEEQQQLRELESRDREVRTHEQAHLAAAGPYATSGPTYSYQQGPDGKRYAIGGEVGIDTSPIDGDPAATARKARIVRAAALAPAEPSSQDRAVAAQATQLEQKALAEQRAQAQESAGLAPTTLGGSSQSARSNSPYAQSAPQAGRLLNVVA